MSDREAWLTMAAAQGQRGRQPFGQEHQFSMHGLMPLAQVNHAGT